MANNETLTLEQLEGHTWGDAPSDASRLVKTVHELRRKPVGQLTAEELRVLLGQRVGVDALVPFALATLERDPLAEGDFYPGDLLVAVLDLPADHWTRNAEEAERLTRIVATAEAMDLSAHFAPADVISAAVESFRTGS
ncbi:contact-dependent growth inhibition system immunity protein [Amycolatopsis sp. WQ 127309]|uniref:contact-dependent growth inhibition system immunity protein n=1 Tax=Amycolatopsis sp. WQ 127309 TaxID=2932773 RepID=UPI001FF4AC92|nr:contact-dependent growth inhibition system immunity protein [Amycolatopsis sp. WQ 127309]UOZ08577.1 contact-dependent growth inhibition system immunity protein [Amycolatopsis sp. WQ 127309]